MERKALARLLVSGVSITAAVPPAPLFSDHATGVETQPVADAVFAETERVVKRAGSTAALLAVRQPHFDLRSAIPTEDNFARYPGAGEGIVNRTGR